MLWMLLKEISLLFIDRLVLCGGGRGSGRYYLVHGVCACHYVDYTFFAQFADGKFLLLMNVMPL